MSKTVKLHVGSVDEMGKRFIDAWHRVERGEKVEETHLTFFDFEAMLSALTPRRLALLRHVHRQPAATVAELARALDRDYKRVHEDVAALCQTGLIARDNHGIRAPFDSVQAIVSLDASPQQ